MCALALAADAGDPITKFNLLDKFTDGLTLDVAASLPYVDKETTFLVNVRVRERKDLVDTSKLQTLEHSPTMYCYAGEPSALNVRLTRQLVNTTVGSETLVTQSLSLDLQTTDYLLSLYYDHLCLACTVVHPTLPEARQFCVTREGAQPMPTLDRLNVNSLAVMLKEMHVKSPHMLVYGGLVLGLLILFCIITLIVITLYRIK